jgi:hypothetical protein
LRDSEDALLRAREDELRGGEENDTVFGERTELLG